MTNSITWGRRNSDKALQFSDLVKSIASRRLSLNQNIQSLFYQQAYSTCLNSVIIIPTQFSKSKKWQT